MFAFGVTIFSGAVLQVNIFFFFHDWSKICLFVVSVTFSPLFVFTSFLLFVFSGTSRLRSNFTHKHFVTSGVTISGSVARSFSAPPPPPPPPFLSTEQL